MAGRIKGKKNLLKENGKIINSNNVQFTEQEQKKLVSLVNSANRKRKNLLEKENSMTRYLQGKPTKNTVGESLNSMRAKNSSDFIFAKKSKSLNKFRNKSEYNHYIRSLEKVVQRDYITKKVTEYKKNFIQATKNQLGPSGKDIVKALNKMPLNEFMQLSQKDDNVNFAYIYSPEDVFARAEMLKLSLNIPEKKKAAAKKKSKKKIK